MSDSSSDVNPLDALAEEFVARHRAGERPSLDEFIARRPDLAGDIRDLFPGLVVMEGVRPAPGDITGPFETGVAVAALKRLGDYRILREVGRGGMGVVYEAEQESLGRHVALKVLPTHSLLEPQRLRRFQREAKAAARLHHTNIVPVYGVGEADGLHYYVMQFIQGLGLDQVLAELRKLRPGPAVEDSAPSRATASAASAARSLLSGRFDGVATDDSPPPSGGASEVHLPGQAEGTPPSRTGREYWRGVARVGVQVGDALAYAHGQGVLHRDVKPSNLLLDAKGDVWVTDFGLAKSADGEDLTLTGDIVGTLRYMAPECFNGRADARSDVYSLGLTLYELLTLRPAFVGKDRNQLLQQVMHGEPPRPRAINRDVPRDLETVVHKAIARDPAHRYQNVAELADDLRRFVDDLPVRARRVGLVEQAWRWGRRNPALAALTTTVLVLLLLGTAGSGIAAYYFSRLAGAEAKARGDADKARIESQNRKNELDDESARMNRANTLIESGQLRADAGQNDPALADFTAAIEQRPDVPRVWLTRGRFYMRFFCWDEAAADYAKGFELQEPVDPNLWMQHAWLRLYVGDREGYRRVCAAMLDKFGQTTDLGTMGDIAAACTAGPNAVDNYSPLIGLMEKPATDGAHPSLLGSLLSVYRRAGQVDEALRLYEKMGANSGWGGGPDLALALHGVGRDDEARKEVGGLNAALDGELVNLRSFDLTRDPGTYLGSYDLGVYMAYREATPLLKSIGAVEHPVFWIARGRGRAALGQWGAATEDVARAVALRPDDPQTRREHGRLLAAQNRWQEAVGEFGKVLIQHPEYGDLWLERGVLYANHDRLEEAAADFNQALQQPDLSNMNEWGTALPQEMLQPDALFNTLARLRPDDAHLWLQRAYQMDLSGKEPDAAAAFDKAVRLRPDDPYPLYARGVYFAQHRRADVAAADFARVLEMLPASPEQANLEQPIFSELQGSDLLLAAMIALRPTDGRLYAVRARWHAGRDEWDKPLADYGAALKLLPDDADIRSELGGLLGQLGRWKKPPPTMTAWWTKSISATTG